MTSDHHYYILFFKKYLSCTPLLVCYSPHVDCSASSRYCRFSTLSFQSPGRVPRTHLYIQVWLKNETRIVTRFLARLVSGIHRCCRSSTLKSRGFPSLCSRRLSLLLQPQRIHAWTAFSYQSFIYAHGFLRPYHYSCRWPLAWQRQPASGELHAENMRLATAAAAESSVVHSLSSLWLYFLAFRQTLL